MLNRYSGYWTLTTIKVRGRVLVCVPALLRQLEGDLRKDAAE
jgi:hypothetical protein